MPRLFTGLEIPDEVGRSLSLLRGGLAGARWIDPENYHITLRFIGDVDDRIAMEIAESLGRVSRAAFAVRFSGLGSFGSKRPHSIWAGLSSSSKLIELPAEPLEARRVVNAARQRGGPERFGAGLAPGKPPHATTSSGRRRR